MSDKQPSSDRGHTTDRPIDIPIRGWKEIGLRVKQQLGEDHIPIIAAGVAFYFFLALFPGIAAFLSIYGLVVDPAQVQEQMGELTALLPQQTHQMLSDILGGTAEKTDTALGWSLTISLAVSLWSTKKGMGAVFEGVNIAYDETDDRGFFAQTSLVLLFTLGAIITGILALGLVLAFPAIVNSLGLPEVVVTIISWGRWLILAIIIMVALSTIYKYAPNRNSPRFRWSSWGAGLATVLWIAASALFSWFVGSFGNFDSTYGSFAAVIILMLWFFLTAFFILLGAEINSEMEHQTAMDTTVGDPQPIGQRGAYHADRVAQ